MLSPWLSDTTPLLSFYYYFHNNPLLCKSIKFKKSDYFSSPFGSIVTFTPLVGVNFIVLLSLKVIGSFVIGLIPFRALLTFCLNLPRVGRLTSPPLYTHSSHPTTLFYVISVECLLQVDLHE